MVDGRWGDQRRDGVDVSDESAQLIECLDSYREPMLNFKSQYPFLFLPRNIHLQHVMNFTYSNASVHFSFLIR